MSETLQSLSEIGLGLDVALYPKLVRPNVSAWCGHLPFASILVKEVKPKIIVELGTHWGDSYFCFCQSVKANKLSTLCYAVDTWEGEDHAGKYDESVFNWVQEYNRTNYRDFSYLLRTTFAKAVHQFADNSIDILHIDGLHTYEAVKNDYDTWLQKVKEGGVVLFHDICCRHNDFGVWKLWAEISLAYKYTQKFNHSYGLGVLVKTETEPSNGFLNELTRCENLGHWNSIYAALGNNLINQAESAILIAHLNSSVADLNKILVERDSLIIEYKSQITQRDVSIIECKSQITQRDLSIIEFKNEISKRDILITELNELCKKFGSDSDENQKILIDRDMIILELRRLNIILTNKILRMQNSASWILTAPLRAIRRSLKYVLNILTPVVDV